MFVKKDLRKIPEILKDHDTNNREEKGPCTTLHLSKRKSEFLGSVEVLRRQPPESLEGVTSLSLYDCDVASVEGVSECLPALQDLSLGRNPIDNLYDVGKLSNLKRLWLEDCSLKNIDSLMSLSKLEELRVSNNSIRKLPDDIGDYLHNLRVLSVDRNSLASLPSTVANMSQLQILQVRQNQLTALPRLLPAGLRILHASSNRIANLPGSLRDCPALARVYLNSNELAEIGPDAVLLPRSLRRLNLSNNSIASIPEGWKTSLLSRDSSGDIESGVCVLSTNKKSDGGDCDGDAGTAATTTTTIILRDNPILDDLVRQRKDNSANNKDNRDMMDIV